MLAAPKSDANGGHGREQAKPRQLAVALKKANCVVLELPHNDRSLLIEQQIRTAHAGCPGLVSRPWPKRRHLELRGI
jgi:hypothetical protein